MNRKLLPYEHQLIDALGITKEEYLAFVAVQQEYKDPKTGTALDIRAADPGTQALVLTIIGILFQVGAALLAPKPKIPDLTEKSQRRSREARFSPTFGFNSAQELASLGDPVNLVYTNTDHNPNGGVRLSGSLVWSAIESYGSAQFMQLLLVMGASRILKIKPEFTAFGQVALQDFDPGLTWMFYSKEGPAKFNDIESGTLEYLTPEDLSGSKTDNVCRIIQKRRSPNKAVGFSQCYTPTTSTAFGPYDPIPIDVRLFSRDEADGGVIFISNGVKFLDQQSTNWFGGDRNFTLGQEIVLQFNKAKNKYDLESDDDSEKAKAIAEQQADNVRRQYVESMNYGTTYMFGTAKFIVINNPNNNTDLDTGNVQFTLECIKAGREPFTQPKSDELEDLQNPNVPSLSEFKKALDQLERDDEEGTDQPGTKTIIQGLGVNINFSVFDDKGISWVDRFGVTQYANYNERGSLSTTEDRKESKIVDSPPLLKTAKLKQELRDQYRKLKQVIQDVEDGKYDDPDTLPSNANVYAKALAGQVDALILNDERLNKRIEQIKEKEARRVKETLKDNPDQNKIADLYSEIENLRKKVANRETRLARQARRPFLDQYQNQGYGATFEAVDGNFYDGGYQTLHEILNDDKIFNELLVDKAGVQAIRKAYNQIIRNKKKAITDLGKIVANYEKLILAQGYANLNRAFFSKCLVKVETASYETVSACDTVRFSIRAKLFRRISGRQREYANDRIMEDYSAGDNGIQDRTCFFRVLYKEVGDATYDEVPLLFAIRRGSESDAHLGLYFEPKNGKTEASRVRWQFKFEPIHDPMAWYEETNNTKVGYITGTVNSAYQSEKHNGNAFGFYGKIISGVDGGFLKGMSTKGPANTFDYDMFSNTTDTQIQFSFENGPELSILAVTEQQLAGTQDAEGAEYKKLSTMALVVRAGKGLQDLRNISTFVEQGKRCFNADTFQRYSPEQSSSYAPDIFVDTVLDTTDGVGSYVAKGSHVLDQDALILAKKFCKNNGLPLQESSGSIQLFMDGIIADQTSWREFWANTAPFSLLELVRKNGKEALVPAIPVTNDGRAANSDGSPIPITVSALFTTGNILEGSYKEEFIEYGQSTQPMVATVVYREMESSGAESSRTVFARQNTVEIYRKDDGASGSDDRSAETFDVSSFVTQREQAIMVGKLLVNQRAFTLRGIEFKTFPTDSPVEPGSYVFIDVGNTTWDSYSSGRILTNGVLNSPLHDEIKDGNYTFLVYNHGTQETKKYTNVSVSNMTASALSGLDGWMYVMGTDVPTKRVFRITEVALEEEGEVRVKAIEYPCYDDLSAKVADFRSSKFVVR